MEDQEIIWTNSSGSGWQCVTSERDTQSRGGTTQIYNKFIPEIVKFIPAFTDQGFHKTRVPEAIHTNLLRFRDESLLTGNLESESPDAHFDRESISRGRSDKLFILQMLLESLFPLRTAI